MERRAGLYRFEVQVRSPGRKALQEALSLFCQFAEKEKLPAGYRWTLDVDPAG
jgi:primosomal protein N'